jgi:type II secretory ATPase GspE/PulE/Tfp pilus assembly ATPase PilB-like protein
MVLRLQYRDFARATAKIAEKPLERPRVPAGMLNLGKMGYSPAQADRLERMQDASSGIVIFTGPTGSGKTTTINEMCKHKARLSPGRRQIAIENPIEYPQPWAVQMVISDTNVMFAEYLRTALRMDPDEIFFGEIRDADCALAVYSGALTGHFIRTTMHTPDAFSVPARFEVMDRSRLPPRLTCDSKLLRGITAQRLVPRLCAHCSEPLLGKNELRIRPDVVASLKTYGDLSRVRVRGDGCRECSGDGIQDRVVVAEVVETDSRLMEDFIDHGADHARRQFRAREDTDNSILHTTIMRVLAGEVDPASVPEYVDPILPLDRVNQ